MVGIYDNNVPAIQRIAAFTVPHFTAASWKNKG